MIAVVQRVLNVKVTVEGVKTGSIGQGLLVLLGVEKGDMEKDLDYIVHKTAGLRIFENNGRMDRSVVDIGGEILVVSQFTLAGDVRHGNRPDFTDAEEPGIAREMYEKCIESFQGMGIKVESGEFGAYMKVDSSGDGPVTILLNSRKLY